MGLAPPPLMIEAFRAQPADLTPLQAMRRAMRAVFGVRISTWLAAGGFVGKDDLARYERAFELLEVGLPLQEGPGRPV